MIAERLGKQTIKRSPYRDKATGQLTLLAMEGQAIFDTNGCACCHSGQVFRDGQATMLEPLILMTIMPIVKAVA